MGDFNFPDINWELQEAGAGGRVFLEQMQDSFLLQKVLKPTRGVNILDLVLTTEDNLVSDMEIVCPVSNSDHNVLLWSIDYGHEAEIGQKQNQRSYKYERGNYPLFTSKLQEIDWERLLERSDVDKIWNELKSRMIELRNELVPIRRVNKRKTAQFIDAALLKRIKKRNKM